MAGLECCSFVPWVLGLFSFAYLNFVYEILVKWLGILSPQGTTQSVIVHFIIFQLYYYYLKTVTTSPGFTPLDWVPEHLSAEELQKIRETAITKRPTTKESDLQKEDAALLGNFESDLLKIKYCRKCEAYKPPRAHHCSDCNRCVLRMDHHCPWVNNCVGYENHKYFMLFLTFLLVGSLYIIILFIMRITLLIKEIDTVPDADPNILDFILLISQLFILVPTFLAVMILFCYQVYLISSNTTGIESFTKDKEAKRAKRNGMRYRYPFDLGTTENIKSIMGSHISVWCIPTTPEGDGIHYKTIKAIDV